MPSSPIQRLSARGKVAWLAAWLAALFAAALAGGAYWAWTRANPEELRMALPVNQVETEAQFLWPASRGWPGTDFLPLIWELDKAHGVRITPHHALAGKGTMDALFAGKADIAIASTSVLVSAIIRGEPLQILAMTTRAKDQVKIITRRENLQSWLDKPIAIRRGTILESVLLAQLQATGKLDLMRRDQLSLVNIENPKNLMAGLLDGHIQTAALIRPHADYVTAALSTGAASAFVDVTLPGAYPLETYMVTTAQRWQEGRDKILKGLAAMRQSRVLAQQNPAAALQAIHSFEAAGIAGTTELPMAWKPEDLVFLTQRPDILPHLEREAALRRAAGSLLGELDFSSHLLLLEAVNQGLAQK